MTLIRDIFELPERVYRRVVILTASSGVRPRRSRCGGTGRSGGAGIGRGCVSLMLVALAFAPAGSTAQAPRGAPVTAAAAVSPTPAPAGPLTPTAPPAPSPSPGTPESVDTQVARILSLMESFIGWLGLLLAILGAIISAAFGIAGWFGWSESRKIRQIREKAHSEVNTAVAAARSAADAAGRALDGTSAAQAEVNAAVVALQTAAADAQRAAARALSDAESAHAQLDRLRDAAQSAMKNVAAEFDELPRLEYGRDERAGPPAVPADVSLAFEEADILLVLCDRLDLLPEREAASRYFVQIGRYWQVIGNYARSLARLERAVAHPGLPPVLLAEGRWQIGRTLLQQAAAGRLDAAQTGIWLDRAERERSKTPSGFWVPPTPTRSTIWGACAISAATSAARPTGSGKPASWSGSGSRPTAAW